MPEGLAGDARSLIEFVRSVHDLTHADDDSQLHADIFPVLQSIPPYIQPMATALSLERSAVDAAQHVLDLTPFPPDLTALDARLAGHVWRGGLPVRIRTLLRADLGRYVAVIHRVVDSVTRLQQALQGAGVFDTKLRSLERNLLAGHVPPRWQELLFSRAHPYEAAVVPLEPFLRELARITASAQRLLEEEGAVSCVDVTLFSRAADLFAVVRDQHAADHGLPFEALALEVEILHAETAADLASKPASGLVLSGVSLFGGAKWDTNKASLVGSEVFAFQTMPLVWLKPTLRTELADAALSLTHSYGGLSDLDGGGALGESESAADGNASERRGVFPCPVYGSVASRSDGPLLVVPLATQEPALHWTMKHVALYCQRGWVDGF